MKATFDKKNTMWSFRDNSIVLNKIKTRLKRATYLRCSTINHALSDKFNVYVHANKVNNELNI